MASIDGPRLAPQSGVAKQLVVFLHGLGADGNDLIDLGEQWRNLRFVREVCGNHPHVDLVLVEPTRKLIEPVATSRDESEVPSVSR